MSGPDVWVSKDDSSDIVRAEAIAGVGRDYNGNVTVRLFGGDGATVTLVDPSAHGDSPTPVDFHRQLLEVVAELSDTAQATMVRPVHDQQHGWRWVGEPL
jgi:hypothetical protein